MPQRLFDRPYPSNSAKRRFSIGAAMLLVAIVSLMLLFVGTKADFQFRLYTNNIRYDNKNPDQNERLWEYRQPLVSSSIVNHTHSEPAVVCLQEVLVNQLKDIHKSLNKDDEWDYYGVGRTDGKESGEFSPIFYRKKDWELVSKNTYWLSPTPEKPSKGWDAALERIVTEVVLKSRESGKEIKVLNTHFDHKGVEARRESVKLIMGRMEESDTPSFLCGDFNTQPTDEPYQILAGSGYQDSRTSGANADEHTATFTGFTGNPADETIIDYIWADKNSKWKSYQVLSNYFEFYMSDHRPVTAEYEI